MALRRERHSGPPQGTQVAAQWHDRNPRYPVPRRLVAELIHTFSVPVSDTRGSFRASVEGEPTPQGTWHGWLVFEPLAGLSRSLRTDRETTQSDRPALEYWASGLEPVYLEGALERAR